VFLLNFYQGHDLKVGGVVLEDKVTVGRNAENHVVLADPSLSRHHAVFFVEKVGDRVQVMLQDFDSTNGCEINGTKFRGKKVRIEPGDTVWVGTHRVELVRKTPALTSFTDDSEQTIIFEGPPHCQESLPLERLRALYDLTSAAPRLGLEELLDATWGTLASCLHYDVLCVLVQNEPGREILRAWNAEGPCEPGSVPVSKRLMDRCIRENLVILADKKQKSSSPLSEDSAAWSNLCSAMCAPLVNGDCNFGAIYVSSEEQSVIYDQDDLKFLILVTNQLSNNIIHRTTLHNLQLEAEKLEAILGSLQEGVIVADSQFIVLSANEAAKKIFGEADLKAKRIEDMLSEFKHTFDRGALPARNRFQMVSTTGNGCSDAWGPRIYTATISENSSAERESWKYVICFHDVTQVERNERMKSLLVNRLAHKLRTPLTVITGVNTLVAQQMEPYMDPELRSMLQQSLEHSQQCAEMIDKFVEYTSVHLGHDSIPEVRCRLEALVAFAVEANRELAARKNFTVIKEFSDETFEVRGREEKLSLVFHHLVQNAVKFGHEGGRLAIGAARTGDTVKVEFRDDGPGIPPAEKEYLFQMLHQVDVDNTGQVPGAGLGLWLARAVLQAHGGEIDISSPVTEDKQGTLVEILLPAPAEPSTGTQPHDAKAQADTVPLE